MSVLLTNFWLLLGSITLGGVLKIPKALGHVVQIVRSARTLLRSSQNLMGRIRDAQKRSALEKEQQSAQKAIEKMETQVKEAGSKNPTDKTDQEIRDIAEKIAKGHGFENHIVRQSKRYPDIKTQEEYRQLIERIIREEKETKNLEKGRTAYWDEESGFFVVENPNDPDGGTAFRPSSGKAYFDRQK